MQLIRSQRPELSAPSSRLEGWLGRPFLGGHRWPALFDWDDLFEDLLPARRLAADLYEDADAYHVRIELPGVKKEDLRVEVENAVLTVSYEKRFGAGEDEQAGESFSRSISIPDDVVTDKLTARLEDGILTVGMPKAEASKPRTIQVD